MLICGKSLKPCHRPVQERCFKISFLWNVEAFSDRSLRRISLEWLEKSSNGEWPRETPVDEEASHVSAWPSIAMIYAGPDMRWVRDNTSERTHIKLTEVHGYQTVRYQWQKALNSLTSSSSSSSSSAAAERVWLRCVRLRVWECEREWELPILATHSPFPSSRNCSPPHPSHLVDCPALVT